MENCAAKGGPHMRCGIGAAKLSGARVAHGPRSTRLDEKTVADRRVDEPARMVITVRLRSKSFTSFSSAVTFVTHPKYPPRVVTSCHLLPRSGSICRTPAANTPAKGAGLPHLGVCGGQTGLGLSGVRAGKRLERGWKRSGIGSGGFQRQKLNWERGSGRAAGKGVGLEGTGEDW